jgi:lysophospholipase L1-like esterase
VLLLATLAPIAVNDHLADEYANTLAQYRSRLVRPNYVFIGDSITAGGSNWGWRLDRAPLSAISLASSGYVTREVEGLVAPAQNYNPRHLMVMAGTNDACLGIVDEAGLRASWQHILAADNVIVTLAPFTASPKSNEGIARVNALVRRMALAAGRKVIDLNPLLAPKGVLEAQYTIDGTHFTPSAYRIWAREIRKAIGS